MQDLNGIRGLQTNSLVAFGVIEGIAKAAASRRTPNLVAQQELFELCVVGGHRNAEFALVEMAGQALG